ncbi:MAG: aminotransferase class III-fold pyridoxal phosphate-dependent enzyme [Xanthomonadales bacterium]|nr:aminotransferase class III-fold pyridoxal phosphate-dependent enzyme [Xanthomonadales bacterium]
MSALLETYAAFPFVLDHGRGDRVWDEEGKEYHDWYGGHCVTATGHAHPRVVRALADQAARLLFYSAAARLRVRESAAEALVDFVRGAGVEKVFFCNSGAEANENALKLAIKQTGRMRLAAFEGGWHGRTLLALSVTDDPKITAPCAPLLAPCARLPFGDAAALEAFDFSRVAAVIVEPMQSMSGIRCAPPAWFQRLRERTAAAGCWLICDEIQTGMGRTGVATASELLGIRPDAITLAKGLASGVPVGATLLGVERAAAVQPGDLGSTFGGGPLAMAALIATIAVIRDEALMARAAAVGARLQESLPGAQVERVHGQGLLLGVRTRGPAAALKRHLFDRRLLVGVSSDPSVLRLMPSLAVSDESVAALESAIHEFQGNA